MSYWDRASGLRTEPQDQSSDGALSPSVQRLLEAARGPGLARTKSSASVDSMSGRSSEVALKRVEASPVAGEGELSRS